MSKMLAYRALMPPHFTPRRNKNGTPETDQDGSRKWVATRLPAIRVFGPFWSFGFNLYEPLKEAVWPGNKTPALRGLRVLAETSGTKANPALAKPHQPTLLSAHPKSFLQVSPEPTGTTGKVEFWESRMSLLAIRSIDPKHIDANGNLDTFDPNDFPVLHEKLVEGPATLIVAPFGDPQPRPQQTFKEDKDGETKLADAVNDQHLPAMQLMHGRVRLTAHSGYLTKVRKRLGLAAPSKEIEHGDTVVLLPDGFALAGAIDVPWMAKKSELEPDKQESSVSGWFKVTFRWLDPGRDLPQKNDKTAGPQPVLRPWLDPEANDARSRAAWSSVIARLESILRRASGQKGAPRWLDIRPNVRLSAEDFFWPLEYDGTKGDPSILLHRPRTDIGFIDNAGLLVRLADRPLALAPLATLTIEPEAFIVTKGADKTFTIESEGKLPPAKSVVKASYSYVPPAGDAAQKEAIAIDTLNDKGVPLGRVDLAVPMVETADNLRQAMGLPRPTQRTDDAKVLPPLWAFTPLDEGWLHWPLPNATPGILSRLIDPKLSSTPDEPLSGNEAGDGISGAILFGNRPGNLGYRPSERSWSFSLGEPRQGSLSATLKLDDDENAHFTAASVELRDFVISFDGVVPVTPFRQTPERLLPDHAERALATVGLRAVSPSSLSELEKDLLQTNDAPRFTVVLGGLQVRQVVDGKEPSEPRNLVSANLSWSLFMPAATDLDAPWIWVRHATLPTVQTMPLAAAGKARNAPGEARALAPFVYEGKSQKLVYACKAGALDMTRGTIALDPTVKGSVGAGGFRRPPGGRAAGGWPLAEWPWRDELGMAVTTLPSLTLFPGLKSAPGIAVAGSWSSYPSPHGVAAVARHDIALRDQFHALAVAPKKPEPGKEAPPPLALFTPRADNAPYGGKATNGYDLVWTELSRKAGLAALDRRDMLSVDKNVTQLVGVFGETSYLVKKVQFDFTVGVTRQPVEDNTQPNSPIVAVTQIGAWWLEECTGVEPSSIHFAGLPQESDLTGISGTFTRGAGKVEVRYGTAALKSDSEAFTDQHGLTTTQLGHTDGVILKRVTRAGVKPAAYELLTLVRPMPIAAQNGLAFWCADVPVDAGKEPFLAAYATDHAIRLNGASLDNDPFAGFRWTLADPAAPTDLVIIDGLVFEPLALTSLTVNSTSKALDTVKIRGRLLLPVGDKDDPVLPRAGGTATLTLTADALGQLKPKLEASDIVWPLVDPQTAAGFVATLAVPQLPGKPATLTFGFADAVFSVALALTWSTRGGLLLSAEKAGGGAADLGFGTINTEKLVLKIGRAKTGQGGKPALMRSHTATLSFLLGIGRSDARLVDTLTHDLLALHDPNSLTAPKFHGHSGIVLKVEADTPPSDLAPPDITAALAFGSDHFAFRWRLALETPEDPRPRLLEGLAIAEGNGAFLATLKVDAKPVALQSLPVIQVIGLEEDALFVLTTWSGGVAQPGGLQLVRRRRPFEPVPAYRLFGKLATANAFSWPLLSVTPSGAHFEEALLPVEPDKRITHWAEITFRGDVLGSDAVGIIVAATVSHTIDRAGETWAWRAHQLVRLMPSAAFLTHLATLSTPGSKKPVDIQKLDTGFSPLVGPAGAPLTDYTAVPHFLHVAASGPGGIAGPLADQLQAAMKAEPTPFLAVDLSAHLLLQFRAGGGTPLTGPLILASLPAVGFCLPQEANLPWQGPGPSADIKEKIRRMFATEVTTETSILQSVTDGIAARSLPALEQAMASRLTARLGEASGRANDSAAAVLLAAGQNEQSHRPVFQAVLLHQNGGAWQPAWELPGAATAMHLSALLDAGVRASKEPIAVGFRPFGGIPGDDLFEPVQSPEKHPLVNPTKIDVGVYTFAMRRFRERLVRDLVAGPGAAARPSGRPQPAFVLLRLAARARDGSGQSVIVEQRESVTKLQLEAILKRGAEWGRLGLERLAPWASTGVAFIIVDEQGVQSGWTGLVRSARRLGARPIRPQPLAGDQSDTPPQRQREQIARPATGTNRFAAGYSARLVEPRLFTSEPASTYGEDDLDYRLTATGVAMAWSLAGGAGAVLGDAPGSKQVSAYWVTDRYRPAFRPFVLPGTEITFALPDDYDAQIPASLVPGNHVAPWHAASRGPDNGTGTDQSFAPPIAITSRISPRAGAMAATRTGLIALVDEGNERRSSLDASQSPLNARQPRPPLLARNDRARASSHEPGPFHLARNPTVILHGPRAAPFGANALPVGLDRSPRSKFAMRVALTSPKFGIAGPDWNGEVRIAVERVFGAADNATWTVKSASIVIGADRYAWQHVATELATDKETSLLEFRGRAGGSNQNQSARDALRALPPATPAVLEITLSHSGPKEGPKAASSLLRQIRFEILSGGAGMAVPGVEAPLFFRFDDPEYNDQLQGLAKLAREPSPAVADEDFVFAADMADIRPDQRLELALALRPRPGADVTKTFESDGTHLTYGGKRVVMVVERQRAGSLVATRLGSDAGAIENASPVPPAPEKTAWGEFFLTGNASTVFHAMKLDCALLREASRPNDVALAPDDQLQLMIGTEGNLAPPIITLRFDVVAAPDMPSNQSSFGILMLKPDGKSVPVHLYALGPDAAVIELVDPMDLVEGVVRRRAIFQWRSFHSAAALNATGEAADPVRFALQKVSGTGGSWLPKDVEGGWLAPQHEVDA